jgi:hypothetical protein
VGDRFIEVVEDEDLETKVADDLVGEPLVNTGLFSETFELDEIRDTIFEKDLPVRPGLVSHFDGFVPVGFDHADESGFDGRFQSVIAGSSH